MRHARSMFAGGRLWAGRLAVAVISLLLASSPVQAQGERILSYDSRVEIQADASLVVTETIRVLAEGQEIKRGIYRDFPQLYRGRWGLTQRTRFDVVSVRRDGTPEAFQLEVRDNGQRVYMGQDDVFLPPGEYTYELSYRTDRQLGFFKDHDELYWNITGNGWRFPIDKVTATVTLPPGAVATASVAYTGFEGGRGRDYTMSNPEPDIVVFETTRKLWQREGVTIVVAWPKGFVRGTTPWNGVMNLLRDNAAITIALGGLLLALVYYFIVWIAVGKDPAAGTIIPLYGPPKGFSPAAVRTLYEMRFDDKAFAANLIGLAVKGAITIQQGEGKEYTVRAGNRGVDLLADEGELLGKLLGSSRSMSLTQANHLAIQDAIKGLKTSISVMLEKTYFVANFWYWLCGLMFSLLPFAVSLLIYRERGFILVFSLILLAIWTVGLTFMISSAVHLWRRRQWGKAAGMTLTSLPFVAIEALIIGIWVLLDPKSIWFPALCLIGALMSGVFYHLLKAPTLAGRKLLDQIEGFRRYLTVAEKNRLNLENPPQRTPELFEMFLPYALALNVEQKWAEQFEDVLAKASAGLEGGYSPSWYSGTAWSTLGSTGFASALGSSMSSAIAASSTAPGSRSGFSGDGGSSGGGGDGGSSGGGGGGGGGGGW